MRAGHSARITALLLVATLVGACSGGASPTPPASSSGGATTPAATAPAEKVTVTFSYLWSGNEAKALESVIAAFNQSQDKIVVKGVSSPDFQKQLAQMSGSSGGFDISDNFGSTVGSWASKGILEPLDTYIQRDSYDLTDFVPAALASNQYQGKTYAMPIAVHTLLLLYNKKLFAEAGIAEPPKTFDELKDDIAKLTKTDASGNLTQLGLNSPDFTTLAYAFGGDWFDAQGNPTPDNAGNLAALHFWADNVVEKYGSDTIKKFASGFGEYASAQNPFFAGKVAMSIEGEWLPVFAKQFAPSLDWGVAPLPYPADKPNLAGSTSLASSMFFIPKNAPHKDAAWEFLKFLESNQGMLDFTYALGNLPARTSLLADPKYNDIPQFSAWLQSLKSPNLKVFASLPYTAEYQKALGDEFQLVATLQETPEQAMANVKAKAAGWKP